MCSIKKRKEKDTAGLSVLLFPLLYYTSHNSNIKSKRQFSTTDSDRKTALWYFQSDYNIYKTTLNCIFLSFDFNSIYIPTIHKGYID